MKGDVRRRTPRSEVYSAAPSDRNEVAVPKDSFQLERLADGGFRLLDPGGRSLTALPGPEGLQVANGVLRPRTDVERGGFLLVTGTGPQAAERGRTMRPARGAPSLDGAAILLDDGRLFEIRSVIGDGAVVFELAGWEVAGAYLRAVPAGAGWALWATPAGKALPEADTIVLLFAAELAEASGR